MVSFQRTGTHDKNECMVSFQKTGTHDKNECMVSFQRTGTHDIFVFNAMEALLMISDVEVTTMACSD